MRNVGPRQLSFVFTDSLQRGGKVEASDVSDVKAALLYLARRTIATGSTAEAADSGRLLERVASPPNLAQALLKVARNKGAPGVDGRSVDEVVGASLDILPSLRRALLEGTYRPGEIRRVWIPKPGGGQRGLGIPNVVDRWVQQAVLQILEPLFEPHFHPSSHGFRPSRGAHTAIAEAKQYVEEGRDIVVDIDLSKFFDRVNHQRLLGRLSQRVDDGGVLKLIRLMLKAKVVMSDGTRVSTREGTPQGGPLSPLLSNIVLDELDWEMDRRGLRFVRYADDVNIFVGSERAGHRVMAGLRRFIEGRLRLVVNEEKSSVTRPENSHFLGFRLVPGENGVVEVYISARTVERLRVRIVELTPRKWGQTLSSCIANVNRYLSGWTAYFRICTEQGAKRFSGFDSHIRRRIRAVIVSQKKRARYLYRHLLSRGVRAGVAARTAFRQCGIWRKSNLPGMHKAYPNAWFAERMVLAWPRWNELNPPASASGQLELFAQ